MPTGYSRNNPTRKQVMMEAAKRGDVDGVLDVLRQSPFSDLCCETRDAMEAVGVALDTLGREDPALLNEELYTRMLAFQGRLLHRVQYFIDSEIARFEKERTGLPIPEHVAETWLPRLARIQASIIETTKAHATVRHTLALAEHGPGVPYTPPKKGKGKRTGKVVPFKVGQTGYEGSNARSG